MAWAASALNLQIFQQRIAALICADTEHFVASPAEAGDTRVPVIVDIPGNIDEGIEKALGEVGLIVVVSPTSWKKQGPQRAKARKYLSMVFVRENAILNRGAVGAATADVVAAQIDLLCDGKANGLTPHPTGTLGMITIGESGGEPIGGYDADLYEYTVRFETEALLL